MAFRLGVDVGGTFTDLFLVGDNGAGTQHEQQQRHDHRTDERAHPFFEIHQPGVTGKQPDRP